MTKRSLAKRSSGFVGHGFTRGRSSPARGSMDGLQLVDVRLHALELHPTPAILAAVDEARRVREINGHPVLFLDELPNAAAAPGWYDKEGGFHPPMGEAGVEALRGLFRDRRLDDHRLPI